MGEGDRGRDKFQEQRKIVEDIGKAAGLVSEVVVKNGWRKMEEWRL